METHELKRVASINGLLILCSASTPGIFNSECASTLLPASCPKQGEPDYVDGGVINKRNFFCAVFQF
jgi:predicted acylesterase/phospholipase RssA